MSRSCRATQHYPEILSLSGTAGQRRGTHDREVFHAAATPFFEMGEGILGPHLPAIAKSLDEARYSTATIRRHLRAADHFGTWLQENNIAVPDVSEVTVDRYIQGMDRQSPQSVPNGRLPHSALGLHRVVEVLRRAEVLKPATRAAEPRSSAPAWLADFDHHLDHVAGCALGSRDNYLRYARRLLQEVFGDAEVDWSRLSASTVTEFVRREAAKLRPSTCGQPVTAIRSLIRFLASKGSVPAGLYGAVPAVRT